MVPQEISFSIEIQDRPFRLGDGRTLQQTAVVGFEDSNRKLVQIEEYGVLDRQEVYDQIAAKQPIALKNVYINGFSLEEYREINSLSNVEVVELTGFSAIHTFFDSHSTTDFSYAQIKTGSSNFSNSIFRSEISFFRTRFCEGEVNFSRVRFHGSANFQYAEFPDGDNIFKDALFEGESVHFVNTKFGGGRSDFANVNFGRAAVAFQYARFGQGYVSFDRAVFGGNKIDFSKVEFGDGKVDFRLVHFGDGDVSFNESEFGAGKVRFRRSIFGSGHIQFELTDFGTEEVSFERSEFGSGKLSFHNAKGKDLVLKACHFNCHIDLRVQQFDLIDLSESTNRDILDLKADHVAVAINKLNFSGMRNLGRMFIDWEDNNVEALVMAQPDTSLKEKADQFRLLKEEYHNAGHYEYEDRAYILLKRLELNHEKQVWLAKRSSNAIWVYPQIWFKRLVFDQIGHYATNPLRVLASMVIAYVIFSVLYILVELAGLGATVSSLGDPDKLNIVEVGFYHSAITFLTIGYGDYYPSGLNRLLSGLEGFVGLFLLSYFTVAFVRKILR